MHFNTINIAGQRFGRWTVLAYHGSGNLPGVYWLCQCDCNRIGIRRGRELRMKVTRSCGCLHSEPELQRARSLNGQRAKPCSACGNPRYSHGNVDQYCQKCCRISGNLKANRVACSVKDYLTIMERAQGRCEACGITTDALKLDHNHDTGQVRGALCHACNTTEGMFKRDYDRLLRLHAYCLRYANP